MQRYEHITEKKLPGKTREVVFASSKAVWFALYSWLTDYRSVASSCHVRQNSDVKMQNIIRYNSLQ